MDPITALVAGHATGKLIDRVSVAFRTKVVERWTLHRATHFFEQFCREVELEVMGKRSDNLDELFDKMLEDELSTELLFDAYRRVSQSKSKSIGPRLIGVLTARLTLENRHPTHAEEAFLFAANELDDDELVAYADFVDETRAAIADVSNDSVTLENGIVRIKWLEEEFYFQQAETRDTAIGPLNFHDSHGTWAAKMSTRDIIRTDLSERAYCRDTDEGVVQVRYVSWWVITWENYFQFADIIKRVSEHARN